MIRTMETLAVVYSALELGIFEFLDGDGRDWKRWCLREGYDTEALEALLNALTTTGFLTRETAGYRLSENGRTFKRDPFLADYLKLAKVYTVMFRYPERVKNLYLHTLDAEDLEIITALGKYNAEPLIDRLLEAIPPLKDRPLRVLDMGCGQGYHLAALASQNPLLQCRGLDCQESVLNLARQTVADLGLAGIVLELGDMRTGVIGDDLDVICCFTALRGMGPDELVRLARRIYAALKDGGFWVVHEFFLEDSRLEPVDNVFFDMKLALAAKGGRVLQRKDFEKFKDVGFAELRMIPLDDRDVPVPGSGFFIYRK